MTNTSNASSADQAAPQPSAPLFVHEFVGLLMDRIRITCDNTLSKEQQREEWKKTVLITSVAKNIVNQFHANARNCELNLANAQAIASAQSLLSAECGDMAALLRHASQADDIANANFENKAANEKSSLSAKVGDASA
jgi:hypothetical protein